MPRIVELPAARFWTTGTDARGGAATGRSATGEGRSISPGESALGKLGLGGGGGGFAAGGAGGGGLGGGAASGAFTIRGAGGGAAAGGGGAAAAPGLFTTNECPHFGHRIFSPAAGTRRSSIWYGALQDSHSTFSIRAPPALAPGYHTGSLRFQARCRCQGGDMRGFSHLVWPRAPSETRSTRLHRLRATLNLFA